MPGRLILGGLFGIVLALANTIFWYAQFPLLADHPAGIVALTVCNFGLANVGLTLYLWWSRDREGE